MPPTEDEPFIDHEPYESPVPTKKSPWLLIFFIFIVICAAGYAYWTLYMRDNQPIMTNEESPDLVEKSTPIPDPSLDDPTETIEKIDNNDGDIETSNAIKNIDKPISKDATEKDVEKKSNQTKENKITQAIQKKSTSTNKTNAVKGTQNPLLIEANETEQEWLYSSDLWVIQYGIFCDTTNAIELKNKMLAKKIASVHVFPFGLDGKSCVRLIVGPFKSRNEALAEFKTFTGAYGPRKSKVVYQQIRYMQKNRKR